jgi:uncharacterized membrane protein YeiH
VDISTFVTALDMVATFAFALVATRIAAAKGLDYGGITLVASVASLAGGTFRNLFTGQRPPWLLNSWLLLAVLVAVLFTVAQAKIKPVGRFVLSLDTLGLAVATVSSANFALSAGAGFVGSAILGLIGGVTGGLLRDVLCQVEPVLLHRETIGTACLVGAFTYVGLESLGVAEGVTAFVGGLVVILVRELSIKFDWHLPRMTR